MVVHTEDKWKNVHSVPILSCSALMHGCDIWLCTVLFSDLAHSSPEILYIGYFIKMLATAFKAFRIMNSIQLTNWKKEDKELEDR